MTAVPASGPPPTTGPPPTVGQPLAPILFDLSGRELEKAGFQGAHVGCPRRGGNAVIVRYDGGPDLASPGVADQIAQIVWANEFDTFDLLAIESRGTTTAFAYQDLAQRFGPQPHNTGLSVEEFCGARFDLNFDKGLGGAGAFAVIFLAAIGIVSVLGLLIATVPKWIAEHRRARQNKRR